MVKTHYSAILVASLSVLSYSNSNAADCKPVTYQVPAIAAYIPEDIRSTNTYCCPSWTVLGADIGETQTHFTRPSFYWIIYNIPDNVNNNETAQFVIEKIFKDTPEKEKVLSQSIPIPKKKGLYKIPISWANVPDLESDNRYIWTISTSSKCLCESDTEEVSSLKKPTPPVTHGKIQLNSDKGVINCIEYYSRKNKLSQLRDYCHGENLIYDAIHYAYEQGDKKWLFDNLKSTLIDNTNITESSLKEIIESSLQGDN